MTWKRWRGRLLQRRGDLAAPVFAITDQDVGTANLLLHHIFVVGQTGSGKSSGVLRTLFTGACRFGVGMICTAYKADAADDMERWATDAGRASSVRRWNGRNFHFNLFAYFIARFGIENMSSVIECVYNVIEIIRQSTAGSGKSTDEFWSSSGRNHIAYTVPLAFGAEGTLRVDDLLRALRTAPQSAEEVNDPEWRARSYFWQVLERARGKIDEATYQRCLEYWQHDFSRLDPKLRSSIHITVVTALARLTQGLLHEAFSTHTDTVPELCFLGQILILDAPYATHGIDGLIFQKIALYAMQEAVLLRPSYGPELRDRILLFIQDEYQESAMPRDSHFMAVARSHRVGVIAATQSLPTLISRIGGERPQDSAMDLLSHFGSKIWLATGCHSTASWASNSIGRRMFWRQSQNESQGTSTNTAHSLGMGENTSWGSNSSSGGSSSSGNGGGSSGSNWSSGRSQGGGDSSNRGRNRGHGESHNSGWSQSQQMDVAIEPGFFGSELGCKNGIVTGIWFRSGHQWNATGTSYAFVSFTQ